MRQRRIDARQGDWPIKTRNTILQTPRACLGSRPKIMARPPAGALVSVTKLGRPRSRRIVRVRESTACGSVLPGCFWDRSHHCFDRSGRSRNPTRGSVGFTRGLSSAGARSTSEFVSRPPNSPARRSGIFLVLLMRRGRVTRRGNMGKPLSRGMGGPGATDCACEPRRREPLGKGGPGGHRDCPPRDKILPVGRELVLMKGRAFLPLLTVPQGRAA
jgi:hypothetical protein